MLRPFEHQAKRHEKTCRHYFSLDERFFEICTQLDESAWRAERAKLSDENERPDCLDRNYPRYHRCAARAHAEPVHVKPHPNPMRRFYIGTGGLLVIATIGAEPALVTAFRPRLVRGVPSFEHSTENYVRTFNQSSRAAVRRADRRASFR